MPAAESAEFDREVTDLVAPYAADGVLTMDILAWLTWGRCQAGQPG
jgi:hypothetical protein